MIERRPGLTILSHIILLSGIAIVAFPLYITFVASTVTQGEIMRPPLPLIPGPHLIENYSRALFEGSSKVIPVGMMMLNSLVMALVIAIGKIAISLTSAFAIVYFRFPFRMLCFWTIFITLMLPVEVRILPTFEVVANLGLLNSFGGLTIPLIASATATFLFRQFFMTIPDELLEAARIDGAGPMRFFRDVVLPLSRTNIAALFVILFIYGWNQYLWPLLITTDKEMNTIVMGISQMIGVDDFTDWPAVMATAMLAMLPPVAIVIFMQRLFIKGLVETEK
ncbi:MAG: sn-glycerol-3-phosphate ABC transporter permease UgpE [Oceanibaculum sp.]